MTFTYSGDPNSSDMDAVRFLVHDTDSSTPLATDEEILWLLTTNSGIYYAAAALAESLSAQFSAAVSKSIGPFSIQLGARAQQYAELAKRLYNRATRKSLPRPYAGGLSTGDKRTYEDDIDRIQTSVRLGFMDNTETK